MSALFILSYWADDTLGGIVAGRGGASSLHNSHLVSIFITLIHSAPSLTICQPSVLHICICFVFVLILLFEVDTCCTCYISGHCPLNRVLFRNRLTHYSSSYPPPSRPYRRLSWCPTWTWMNDLHLFRCVTGPLCEDGTTSETTSSLQCVTYIKSLNVEGETPKLRTTT